MITIGSYSQVRLPLDINHTCATISPYLENNRVVSREATNIHLSISDAERACPACQYIRGYLHGQQEARPGP